MALHPGKRALARGRQGREAGQALIELALVAPLLILILAGLVQFALIFERQIGINNAIRDAARIAATFTTPDTGTAQANATWTLAKVQSLLANSQSYDASQAAIKVCIGTPSSALGLDPSGTKHQVWVKIDIAYRHPVFLPIVDLILDGIDGTNDRALLASATTQFNVEQPGDNNVSGQKAWSDGTTGACTL